MFSNRTLFSILAAVALACTGGMLAQEPTAAPTAPAVTPPLAAPAAAPASAVPDLVTLQAASREAEAKLPSAVVKTQSYFDLQPAERARWQQFLPRTLQKLTRREPVQIVVLGDAILEGAAADSGEDPLLKSFAGVFAKALARQFYYTGGVRVIRAGSALRSKESMVLGPEIMLQPVQTASIVSAASALTSVGYQGRPDVILVAYGLEDGMNKVSAVDIQTALKAVLAQVRAKQFEMLVAGPIPQVTEPEEMSLALTRTGSSVMRDFCAQEKLLFSDLGDLSRLILPESGPQAAHLLFPSILQQYQSRLSGGGQGRVAVPSAALHEALGSALYEDVMRGPQTMPWKVSPDTVTATLQGQGKLKLSFEVANSQQAELALTMLPLVPAGFRLKDANAEVKLAPGTTQKQELEYTIEDTRFLPLADGKVRFPVLMIAGRQVRIEDVVATLQPFSAVWNGRTTFNVEAEFNPQVEVENNSGKGLSGTWNSTWQDKKLDGKFSLEASGAETPTVSLGVLADDKASFRQRLPLSFVVEAGGVQQNFDRHVELTRNFGLKQPVALTAKDGQASGVTLQADADSKKLFLTLDLGGVDLADDATGRGYELLINLDARSYGQRQTPGATAALRITGRAGDGPATVDPVAPWAFGTGYAAEFDTKEFGAALSSSPSGARRITLSIPKSYLYKHEWALGNGNSQLGINVRLSGGGRDYFLTQSSRHPDDAEALSVLELTDKPTRRWTARLE